MTLAWPWNDRAGTFSPLKAVVLAGVCLPVLWLAWQATQGPTVPGGAGPLGPRPITQAIHEMGDWSIRFLMLSLAVTPLRRIANWPKLILVRRMLGLTALFYALGHFALYIADQKFDMFRVASEIVLRFYLTIGFVALLGLVALGATSTDAAIRRLGKNWVRLHKAVYAIGLLAALHYFIQSKADVYQPTLIAGLFLLLMLCRLAKWRGFSLQSPLVLVALAIVAGLGTFGIEYAWYGLATGVPPGRVFAANWQWAHAVRPAWWVLLTGVGVAIVAAVRPLLGKGAAPQGRGQRGRVAA
jgi:sulfoxide reductase heme-binding subunit YedZ